MIRIHLIIGLILFLFSCSTEKLNKLELTVIQIDQNSNAWSRVDGIPSFDVNLHSDGCSGGMSAIYSKLKFLHKKHGKTLEWRECCEDHDYAYYYGGTKNQKVAADEELGSCVADVVGNKFFGKTMQIAVDIGGGPYLPTPYRWGYGEDFRK